MVQLEIEESVRRDHARRFTYADGASGFAAVDSRAERAEQWGNRVAVRLSNWFFQLPHSEAQSKRSDFLLPSSARFSVVG